ncbi:lipopolysaccharide export system protein LptA [Selenomonas sp. GACV-9]|uniref:LptA/OstA family protein n=1 Tax=Selenomonas sp. GACV-9 TaxID=3158782 RepID=UPI0008EA2B9A|nr:lipopolysaccharide export system protein LptA [Selenomonas ruminantium]
MSKMKKTLLALAVSVVLPMSSMSAAGEPAELDADTVTYDMSTGVATATGDVLMKRGTARVSGATATYNSKTQEATVEGNVIATRDDMRMTCAKVVSDGQGHIMAVGSVQGVQGDKSFAGEQVDYYPEQGKYVLMPSGGTLTSADSTFTANRIEGWLDAEHYIGTGNAHVVSTSRNMEAGGDQMDYQGKEQGVVVVTGNAWAIQDNNTLKSNRLTLYLAQDGQAKVK